MVRGGFGLFADTFPSVESYTLLVATHQTLLYQDGSRCATPLKSGMTTVAT